MSDDRFGTYDRRDVEALIDALQERDEEIARLRAKLAKPDMEPLSARVIVGLRDQLGEARTALTIAVELLRHPDKWIATDPAARERWDRARRAFLASTDGAE